VAFIKRKIIVYVVLSGIYIIQLLFYVTVQHFFYGIEKSNNVVELIFQCEKLKLYDL
jgi:hypothetical protein